MCVGYSTKSLKKRWFFQQHLRGVGEEFCDWEASSSFNLSQKLLEMDGSLGAPKWDEPWDSVGGSPRRRPPPKMVTSPWLEPLKDAIES